MLQFRIVSRILSNQQATTFQLPEGRLDKLGRIDLKSTQLLALHQSTLGKLQKPDHFDNSKVLACSENAQSLTNFLPSSRDIGSSVLLSAHFAPRSVKSARNWADLSIFSNQAKSPRERLGIWKKMAGRIAETPSKELWNCGKTSPK